MKRMMALIAAMSLALMLSGCGGDSESDLEAELNKIDQMDYDDAEKEIEKNLDALDEDSGSDEFTESTDASAEDEVNYVDAAVDDLTYEYDAVLKGVIITGYHGGEDAIRIPAEINGDPVVMINLGQYEKFTARRVELPEGVTDIESFAGKNIEEVIIPNSVTTIGYDAFASCDALTEISIPDSVTEIGGRAFYDCDELKKVSISDSVTEIGKDTFNECVKLAEVTLPSGLKSIKERAFQGCHKLTEITVPDGVESIGEYVFYSSGLEKITLPDSLETIEAYAFLDCDKLTEIDIPDGIKSIGRHAFTNSAVRSITLPDSIESVDQAFYECKSLTVTYKGKEYNYANWDDLYNDVAANQ